MDFNSRFFLILILFGCNFSTFATSISYIELPEVSDKDALDWATDVVEGNVVEIIQNDSTGSDSCFENVYKLQISDVLKGAKKIGDEIVIGLTGYALKFSIGQKHLAIVGTPFSEFYQSCDSEKLSSRVKLETIKVNHSRKSSIYIIEKTMAEEKNIFSLLRCSNDTCLFQRYSKFDYWL